MRLKDVASFCPNIIERRFMSDAQSVLTLIPPAVDCDEPPIHMRNSVNIRVTFKNDAGFTETKPELRGVVALKMDWNIWSRILNPDRVLLRSNIQNMTALMANMQSVAYNDNLVLTLYRCTLLPTSLNPRSLANIRRKYSTNASLKLTKTGNPIDPAITMILIVIYIHWLEFISAAFDIPPFILENPALQNADTEWNAENTIWSFSSICSTSCIDSHIHTAPAVSMAMVKKNMYNNVGRRAFMDLV